MGNINLSNPSPVVILGNGQFPTHPIPLEKLRSAKTLICINGGADLAVKNGFSPSLLIGDLDSLKTNPTNLPCEILKNKNQENTDLEKALNWCIKNNILEITLIGVTGCREDHLFANLLAMKQYSNHLNLLTITDYFSIVFVQEYRDFSVTPGQIISILSFDNSPYLTTTGLKYNLDHEPLLSPGHGISNITTEKTISLVAERGGVFVFFAHLL